MKLKMGIALGLMAGCALSAGADEPGRKAEVWVSSANLQHKLDQQAPSPFVKSKKLRKLPCIGVDPDDECQTMAGIGSSFEHATCYNLSLLEPARRGKVIEDLVHPAAGIGMSLMRICIGTSDFTGEPWYSYDDMPEGESDPGLEHFSIKKDRAYILPVLKTALEKNPKLKFFASPWSPPGWMKNSGQMCGGRLRPECYDVFARYLIKFIQAYEAEGIPIYAITLQNEPGVNVKTYPSCYWNGEMQRDFIKNYFGPALEQSGLKTCVWCFDHNFNNIRFPEAILSDPEAAQYVDGTAFHHYEGKAEAMAALHGLFPDKHIYFTEGSVYNVFGAQKIISFFRNGAQSYNAWVTIIDHRRKPNNGPHGCSPTCIVLNSDTLELEYRFDYYMYGHFAKFVKPGAVRLGSGGIERYFSNAAFRNPDGSIVLIVVNSKPEEKEFKIQYRGRMIRTTLGPKSIATYRWRG